MAADLALMASSQSILSQIEGGKCSDLDHRVAPTLDQIACGKKISQNDFDSLPADVKLMHFYQQHHVNPETI